jgi:hypothetical protein
VIALPRGPPADEAPVRVEQQRARRGPGLGGERDERAGSLMRPQKGREVDVAQHIDVVDEEGAAVIEEPGGLPEAAARVEKLRLPRIRHALQSPAAVLLDKRRDHFAVVVQIDDRLGHARGHEPAHDVLEQRDSVDFHQSLGARGGQGGQAGAAAGG